MTNHPFPAISNPQTTTTGQYSGDVIINLRNLVTDIDLSPLFESWRPIIKTQFLFRSGKIAMSDPDLTNEISIAVADFDDIDGNFVFTIPAVTEDDTFALLNTPQIFDSKVLTNSALGSDFSIEGFTLNEIGALKIKDKNDNNVPLLGISGTAPNTHFDFLSGYKTSVFANISSATDLTTTFGYDSEIDKYEWYFGTTPRLQLTNTELKIMTDTVNFDTATITNLVLAKSNLPTSTVYTDQNNTYGIGAIQSFRTGMFKIYDTNASHRYTISTGDLTADVTLNLPVLTANDTFAMTDFAQTLLNKTLTSPTINSGTLSGTFTLPSTASTYLEYVKPTGNSAAENFVKWRITESIVNYVSIENMSPTNGVFAPRLVLRQGADPTFPGGQITGMIQTTTDSGDEAALVLVGQTNAGALGTRPIVSIKNWTTNEYVFGKDSADFNNNALINAVINGSNNTITNIPDTALSSNVPLLDVANTFTDIQTIQKNIHNLLSLNRDSNGAVEWGVDFNAKNSDNVFKTYAAIRTGLVTNTVGDEDAYVSIQTIKDGTVDTKLIINHNGNLYIGPSSARAIFNVGNITSSDKIFTLPNQSGTLALSGALGSMDDLTDADTTTVAPVTNDVLTWDGTNWVPAAPPGASGGEANTLGNVGTGGVSIVASPDKTGTVLNVKSINAGSPNITVTDDPTNKNVDIDVGPNIAKLDAANTFTTLQKIQYAFTTALTLHRPTNVAGNGTGFALSMLDANGVEMNYGLVTSGIVSSTEGSELGSVILAARNGATLSEKLAVLGNGQLQIGSIGTKAILDPSNITANRTFAFPNISGLLMVDNNANVFKNLQRIEFDAEAQLELYRPNSITGDRIGMEFKGENSIGEEIEYGKFYYSVGDDTDGSEDSNFGVLIMSGGTQKIGLYLSNSGLLTIGVNNKITLSDSGQSANHTFTFPDQSGQVALNTIKLDDVGAPDDNTDLNASITKHGLLPKLSGTATQYLDGSGAWSVPAGGGGASALDDLTDVVITTPATNSVLKYNGTSWIDAFVDWTELTGKPSTFTPTAHTHAATDITSATLPVARGGTGKSSITQHALLKGGASNAYTEIAVGSNDQVLAVVSGTPAWKSLDSERTGKALANGNGSTTVFNIAHGLGATPSYAFVDCSSHAIARTWTVDGTNITVTFTSAPSSGTNNVVIYWRVIA